MQRGRFIVFEGGEASGKSTQARLLAEALGAELTREPGGTPLGERVREVLLDERVGHVDDRAELLLMLAARAQHVAETIRPNLEAGRDVVCDRFSGSTIAYQAYGRGLDLATVTAAEAISRDGLEPDLVLLMDLPLEKSAERRSRPADRIEQAGDAFFERVRSGYAQIAASNPKSWVVIDAAGSRQQVSAEVRSAIAERFGIISAADLS